MAQGENCSAGDGANTRKVGASCGACASASTSLWAGLCQTPPAGGRERPCQARDSVKGSPGRRFNGPRVGGAQQAVRCEHVQAPPVVLVQQASPQGHLSCARQADCCDAHQASHAQGCDTPTRLPPRRGCTRVERRPRQRLGGVTRWRASLRQRRCGAPDCGGERRCDAGRWQATSAQTWLMLSACSVPCRAAWRTARRLTPSPGSRCIPCPRWQPRRRGVSLSGGPPSDT